MAVGFEASEDLSEENGTDCCAIIVVSGVNQLNKMSSFLLPVVELKMAKLGVENFTL